MKRFSLLFFLSAFALTLVITSCNNDEEEDPSPDACQAATFPPSTGAATVNFKNFSSDPNADGIIDVSAAAGDFLSIATEIIKGNNRPQKLRVYQTDCPNQRGTLVSFEGQPKTEDQGKTIDLTNTDDPQVRTLLYEVPAGFSSLYLNFEVDESGGNYTYKRMRLNISGSGVIDSHMGIVLGGNTNANASRMSSATGIAYKACETEPNIQYIDITYAVSTGATSTSYLASNPARFVAPINLSASTVTCGDETFSTAGGSPTYFRPHASPANFDAANDLYLENLTVSNANTQYVQVTGVGEVFEFLTSNGRKGLIKVTEVNNLNNPAGSITVSVKSQR